MTTEATPKVSGEQLDQLCINAIRILAADGVQKANSGHPGAPMGMAAMAYTLWTRHLRFNPQNPHWFNRDRFILSNGHASMLIYSLLHLTGYALPIEQLQQFRQWGSITPGHPEYGMTPGVEVTTGPLGQGVSNVVGMAIAEQYLASTFNQPGQEIIEHYTYAFAGDGCLMEGISSEAHSLAGHLQLGKLIVFYDDNEISIDGNTKIAFTENVPQRYAAYGWHVEEVADGNDIAAIDEAIRKAQAVKDKPSIIVCHTVIGFGSPNRAGTAKAHGQPLGKDEMALTRQKLGWNYDPFVIPEEVYEVFRGAGRRGAQLEAQWNAQFDAYKQANPELGQKLDNAINRKLVEGWDAGLKLLTPKDGPVATRNVGGKAINAIAETVPTLVGGSADLNESTFTKQEHFPDFEPTEEKGGNYAGRNLNFGVREHAMGAIVNGLAAHGGFWTYGSTFFVFSDYMRPAVRLAAIMNVPSIFVWTHDSVAVGEDGPTHEPIEHLMSLRAIPNFTVIRPADANETLEAWRLIPQLNAPVGLILTRQKLPVLDQEKFTSAANIAKGAYILSEASNGQPKLILIATGSEVSLAIEAQPKLEEAGIPTRVVSMPSWELFEQQSEEYQEQVLPANVTARLSLELGITLGWEHWVGAQGASLGLDHFGASAPYERVLKEFGFTVENVTEIGKQLVVNPKAVQKSLRDNRRKFAHGGHISSAPASGYEGHS